VCVCVCVCLYFFLCVCGEREKILEMKRAGRVGCVRAQVGIEESERDNI
jgi:hypothetical protein